MKLVSVYRSQWAPNRGHRDSVKLRSSGQGRDPAMRYFNDFSTDAARRFRCLSVRARNVVTLDIVSRCERELRRWRLPQES